MIAVKTKNNNSGGGMEVPLPDKNDHLGVWGTADRILDYIIIIVVIIIMLFCSYSLYDAIYLYRHTNPRITQDLVDSDGNPLIVPSDSIAWLKIDGTNISHPVMQGKTNGEYLDKSPLGYFSPAGSIYLDSRNNSDWTDEYNLLYGHHLSAKQMFGTLDLFKEKNFFETHQKGTLKTNKTDYNLKVCAIVITKANESVLFNVGKHAHEEDLTQYIKEHSILYSTPDSKQYLAMSTCQDIGSSTRLIVIASMSEAKSPGSLKELKKKHPDSKHKNATEERKKK